MAHLGEVTVATDLKYKKLSDISDIVLEDGKTYIMQVHDSMYVLSSPVEPTRGGFYIKDFEIFTYTKVSGEDLWVKADFTVLNIAE